MNAYDPDVSIGELLGASRPRTLAELKASVQAAPDVVDTSRGAAIRAADPWRGRSSVQEPEAEVGRPATDLLNPVAQGRGLADVVRSGYRVVTGEGTADDVVNIGAAIATGRISGYSAKNLKFSSPEIATKFSHVYTPKQQAAWAQKLARMSVQDRLREIQRVEAELREPELRYMAGSDYKYAKPVVRWDARQAELGDRAKAARLRRQVLESGLDEGKHARWGRAARPARPEAPETPRSPGVPKGVNADFGDFRSKSGAARLYTPDEKAKLQVQERLLEEEGAMLAGSGSPALGRNVAGWWKSFAQKHPWMASGVKWGVPSVGAVYAVGLARNEAAIAKQRADDADLVRSTYSSQVDQAMMRLARHEAASTNEAAVASFWSAPDEVIADELGQLARDVDTVSQYDPTNAPPRDTVARILHNYGHTPVPHRDRFTGAELSDYSDQYNALVEALRAKEAENAQR